MRFGAMVAIWALTSTLFGQDIPDRPPRIAVVSLQGVYRDSIPGKAVAGKLDALQKEFDSQVAEARAEVDKASAAVSTLQDEIEKQGPADEAREDKERDLRRKNRDLQALAEDSKANLQRARQRLEQRAEELKGEFQAKIRPYIEAVSKEKAIDILLESQAAAIGVYGPEADLTKDVVAKVDAAEHGSP
jgi:Skp family chaperone for outer membrane proteins